MQEEWVGSSSHLPQCALSQDKRAGKEETFLHSGNRPPSPRECGSRPCGRLSVYQTADSHERYTDTCRHTPMYAWCSFLGAGDTGALVYRTLGSWTGPACVLRGSFLPMWSSWSVQVLPPHEPSSSLVCSNPSPVPSHPLRPVTRRVFPSAARLRPASPLHLTSSGKWLSYAPLSLLVGQVAGERTADRLLEGRGGGGVRLRKFRGPWWDQLRRRCRLQYWLHVL